MKNQNRNNYFLYFLGGMVILAFSFLYSYINSKDTLAYSGRNLQLDDSWANENDYPTTKISYNQESCVQIETVNHLKTSGGSVYTLSRAIISSAESPSECVNPERNAFRKIELNGALNFHLHKYSLSSDMDGESAMYTVTIESFNGVLEPGACKKIDADMSAGALSMSELSEIQNAACKDGFLQRLRNRFKSL